MFEKLISKLGSVLTESKTPYMIIGGQAVLLYGSPRLTRDIDITLGVSIDALPDVVAICKAAGLRIIPDDYQGFVQKTFVLPAQDKTSGIRVDFIFSFTPYEQQAIKRARKVKIRGRFVKFASAEDLIIHKIFAGRPRDMEDIRHIIIKNPAIDRAYIRKWLRRFDKSGESRSFTNSFNNILEEISGR